MKKTALATGPLVLFVCSYGTLSAQERSKQRKEMQETIQIWRLHKLRESLELTAEQSAAVLRVEENRNRRERELRERAVQAARGLKESLDRGASDSELGSQVDAILALQGEGGKIRENFQSEMRRTLNVRQQAKYVLFEMRFKKKVREMMARARAERLGEHGAPRPPRPREISREEDFDF